MPEGPAQEVDTRSLITLAFSATAGVMIEIYDFTIFGFAVASAFPQTFFPTSTPGQALFLSYLTYGAGHPARLVGALLFGHFGDRIGRKPAFVLNILVVGGCTFATGLLPGYATLGVAAPLLLVLLRLIQGVGLGGEFGGATSLLAEFGARRRCRSFWISLANLGVALGLMASSVAFLLLHRTFATTGWRVAMLLSGVIVVPALVARYKLSDSPLFEQLKRREQLVRLPSLAVFRTHAVPIVLLATLSAFQLMDAIVTGTFLVSFMSFAGISLATVGAIILISRIGDIAGVLLSGPLADFFDRKTVAYFAIAVTSLLSYPFVLAILGRRILLVTVLQFLIVLFGVGLLHGLAPILSAETFPTRFRYSGAGISFSLAGILGGTIAPLVLVALVGHRVHENWYYIPLVYAGYGVAAILALLFIKETRDLRLEDLDRPQSGLVSPRVERPQAERARPDDVC